MVSVGAKITYNPPSSILKLDYTHFMLVNNSKEIAASPKISLTIQG